LLPAQGGSSSCPGDAPTLLQLGSPDSAGYIGDPDMIRSLASSPFSGRFSMLCANDVKSQQLRRPSMGASLGFVPRMWKAFVITHHIPFLVPFRSLEVLLLLAT
jgi:hypothetical protein